MRRRDAIGLALMIAFALLATLLGRSFTVVDPSPADGRLFLYIGEQWRLGRLPYVDVWENKPPGIFALAALASVFPDRFVAMAVLEGVFVLGCVLAVHGLLRRLGAPPSAAILAAAAAALAANLRYYNQHGLCTEIFVLWPAAASMLFFARALPELRVRWVFLAGAAAGAASLFKTPGLSPFLAQATLLLFLTVGRREPWRRTVAAGVAGIAGVAAAWLPFMAYFGWRGGLTELVDATLLYNLSYGGASQPSLTETLLRLGPRLQPLSTLVAGTAIAVAALLGFNVRAAAQLAADGPTAGRSDSSNGADGPARRHLVLLLLWVFFDLLGAAAGGRNYPHYYLPLAASLSATSGMAVWSAVPRGLEAARRRLLNGVLAALLLAPPFFEASLDVNRLRRILEQGPVTDRTWVGAADRLRDAAGEGSTLFTWNFLPGLYLETGLRSPIRFLSAHYLADSPEAYRRFSDEILTGLESDPPTFTVDGGLPPDGTYAGAEAAHRRFRELLARRYELTWADSSPRGLRVYRLREDAGG